MPAFFKKHPTLGWVLLVGAVCVGFAAFTQHRWEDYYITLRASRNLVEGHGLVFQPGEKVHTFTSPLGVLLPALSLALAGVENDVAVIWTYRVMCIAAFAGAVALLWQIATALNWPRFARGLLPVLLLTDAKSVDFTINGMETAFMLCLLMASVHTLVRGGRGGWWRLGLCWGGLMWTRPDGFIFGGMLAFAWLVVFPDTAAARNRAALLRSYVQGALLAGVIYLPWFCWAWSYYGTAVPHTIIAKGLASHPPHLLDWPMLLVRQTILFPWRGGLRDAFLPAYVWFGGWPCWLKTYLIGVTWVCLLYFLRPGASRWARLFSLTFFLCSLYGTAAPSAPWYVPSHAIFALLTLAAMAAEAGERWPQRTGWRVLFVGHAALCAGLLLSVAWQLRQQQAIIEGQRTEMGRWLRANSASPLDSVWLEPLGYIGYFSQLKMLDFPGLCAPSVVAARRELGDDWPRLIRRLHPTWLVLRRNHLAWLNAADPALIHQDYQLARTFDAAPAVAAIRFLPGRSYLEQDQTFDIYRRQGTVP